MADGLKGQGQARGIGQLPLAARLSPQANHRAHCHVERALGSLRQFLRAFQHEPEFVADPDCLARAGGPRKAAQFTVIFVVAENGVEFLDPIKRRAGGSFGGWLVRGVQDDAKRQAHLRFVELETPQVLGVAGNH